MAQRERTRHVPSPLNFQARSPPPLLYDLPSASFTTPSTLPTSSSTPRSPRSPPRTPRGRSQVLLSPKIGQQVARSSSAGLHHPQPSNISQSSFVGAATPSRSTAGTPTQELEAFGALCRTWYFQQDSDAGAQIQETMRTLPASQRAAYTRLQAQIRSSYHTAVALRRESEFHAHLTSTKSGQSLSLVSRQNPSSGAAQNERLERTRKFVSVWATSGNVGTRPFFQGLFAVLRLQALPVKLGGAGGRRVSWELDDAVFKESAGKEFMLEAVDILKGVLGFEEASTTPHNGGVASDPISLEDETPVRPVARGPPPPPPRRLEGHIESQRRDSREGRPSLPTIASASIIHRRRDASDHPNDDRQGDLVEVEEDMFADPVIAHQRRPSSSLYGPHPSILSGNNEVSLSSQRNKQNAYNRHRSPSDPFADTNGHLNFGHGRNRTQGSLGTLSRPGVDPSSTTLVTNGSGSVGTTADSLLTGKTPNFSGSHLKKTVPLPPEDLELETTGPPRTGGVMPVGDTPDSDEEEGVELLADPDSNSRRLSAFSLSLLGKTRRESETAGLGLVGTGLAASQDVSISASASKGTNFRRQKGKPASANMSPVTSSAPTMLMTDGPFTRSSHLSVEGEPYLRTWTFPPYIGNSEITGLLAVFPTSISSGAVPRFKDSGEGSRQAKEGSRSRRVSDHPDLEAQTGDAFDGEREALQHGTGKIWMSFLERDEGWMGTLWDRFKSWWRRVFC